MSVTGAANGSVSPTVQDGYVALSLDTTPGTWEFADIYRVRDGDRTQLRNGVREPLNTGDWVGSDHEAPLGEPVHYEFDLFDNPDDDTPVGSVKTDTPVIVPPQAPGRVYLHNVISPSTILSPQIEGIDSIQREAQMGVYPIIGRSAPVVVAAARGSRQGSIRVLTKTLADRDALWAMFESGDVLLLRSEAEYGIGSMYLAVSNVTEERITRFGWVAYRRFTLEFIETERPVGSALTAANNSWQVVLTGATDWQTLMDLRASWSTVYVQPIGSAEEGEYRGDVPDL